MKLKTLPTLCLAGLLLAMAARLASLWPALPDRIAIHFDASGQPDGWSSRSALLIWLAALLAIFAGGFGSTFWLARVPDRLINLPRKAYWLAPERRDATIDVLAGWMRWLLVATLAFVGWVLLAAIEASLAPSPRLDLPVWQIWAFALFVLAMLGWLLRRLWTPR